MTTEPTSRPAPPAAAAPAAAPTTGLLDALLEQLAASEQNGMSTIQPLAATIARDALAVGVATCLDILRQNKVPLDKFRLADASEHARLVYAIDLELRREYSSENGSDGGDAGDAGEESDDSPADLQARIDEARARAEAARRGNP